MPTFLKTTESFIHGARTMPRRYYTSPDVYAEEAEQIFARSWLCVGRAASIVEPGAYLAHQSGDESVIVLRDKSGAVRAFHNVCRHRGTRLCEQSHGKLRETIQCP